LIDFFYIFNDIEYVVVFNLVYPISFFVKRQGEEKQTKKEREKNTQKELLSRKVSFNFVHPPSKKNFIPS